jgi:hypothetical protein
MRTGESEILKINRHIGGTCHLYLQGRRISQVRKQNKTCHLLHAGFLFGLFFELENGKKHIPLKHWLIFNGLHGVLSQNIELFNTTAVKT